MNKKATGRFFILITVILLLFTVTLSSDESKEGRQDLLLSFTGDLMAHSINYRMDDYSKIYRNVSEIFLQDDLTFTNAEFPMDPGKPMASFPSFNIHPAYVQAFIDAGLDVFSLANNHIGDIGSESLVATWTAASRLAEDNAKTEGHDVYFSGVTSKPQDEYEITEIRKNGWKIGFLAVTQKSNIDTDPLLLYQVDYLKEEETVPFLTWLSNKTAEYDLFILSYHGGVEYNFIPGNSKRIFFHSLLNAGVDIVWGHHPHVIQEIEIVKSEGVILYSMGNFLSGQGRIIDEILPEEEWSYTGDSAVLQIKISEKNGVPSVDDVLPIPVANYITPNREVIIYPLEELLLHPLPSPWNEFYLERGRIMSGYFSKNIKRVDPIIQESSPFL